MSADRARQQHVLVTGGAGFIGANLVRLLCEAGYTVSVLDNLSVGRRENLAGVPVAEVIQGDTREAKVVRAAVRGQDAVVHLAAQTGVPGSLKDPKLDSDVNVAGTLNVLEACRAEQDARNGTMGFVFASSNAPLGRQAPPATEDKAPLPLSPYGASKAAGEAYCLAYHGSWGVRTVALRFANVYGPWSLHKNSVVAKFFKDIAQMGCVTVEGDGGQTRDFVYVEDLCRAILQALRSDVGGEIFQIATGRETSIGELAELIRDVTGRAMDIVQGRARVGDIRRNYSMIRKAAEGLGWHPEVDLHDGLARTWDWFCRGLRDRALVS